MSPPEKIAPNSTYFILSIRNSKVCCHIILLEKVKQFSLYCGLACHISEMSKAKYVKRNILMMQLI